MIASVRLPRAVLAIGLGGAMLTGTLLLARADTPFGAPLGADRLVAAADAASPAPADAGTATAILHARPIDGRGFRLLAVQADVDGNSARANALYATAVRLAPRDRAARIALLDRAFARGDIEDGTRQLDALLRVAPTLATPLLRALSPHFGDPRLAAPLARHLRADPPWRGSLPGVLRDPAVDAQGSLVLLDTLATTAPLTPTEADTRADLLRRLGRDADARAGWLARLPTAVRATSATLTDGGFEHADLTGTYAWQQSPPPGVVLRDDPIAAAEGAHALALDFSGRAITDTGLQQALALAPGRYRFAAQSDNATDAQRPFAWQLQCAQGAPLLSLPLPTTPQWQASTATFDVPAGCTGQRLRLAYLGRSLADRQVKGTLRVDAVRIENVR